MSFVATNLGFLPGGSSSSAQASSDTGLIVVGDAFDVDGNQRAVYWDASNVIHLLPSLGSETVLNIALGCNPTGSVIVGASTDGGGSQHAVTWTGGPSWVVTALASPGGDTFVVAQGCSNDGVIVVGSATIAGPLVWVSGVLAVLPLPGGYVSGTAKACSADGSIIAGTVSTSMGATAAATWTGGPSWVVTVLADLAGGLGGSVSGCSSNGAIFVGEATDSLNESNACFWNPSLNVLTDPLAGPGSEVFCCDATGTILGGVDINGNAVIWTSDVGQDLPPFSGGTVVSVNGVSSDGTFAAGIGNDSDDNQVAVKWNLAATESIVTVADLFFSPTAGFVDFTQVANRRKFVSVNGGAQNLQPDGRGPFAVTPAVFLSLEGPNAPNTFAQNQGRGGPFLITGPALTDGATDPPPVSVSTTTVAPFVPFSSVLGDYLSGNIYTFNQDALTDNGAPRKWLRRWRALPNDTTSAITFSYLAIDMETGTEVPPGTNPQLVLRWSDDGGKTWSGNRIIPVGATGQTTFTVKFNRLGSTKRFGGSTRIFELSSTDPFKVSILSAEVLTK